MLLRRQHGQRHARRYVARGGTARRARVPPMHYVDKPTSIAAQGGHDWTRNGGRVWMRIDSHRDAIGIRAELDMRRIGSGQAPADKPRVLDQQMMLPKINGLHPISRDLAS